MSRTYIPVALRNVVYERAKAACEYCLTPEMITFAPHQIDHVIAEKHGGATEQDNLALACIQPLTDIGRVTSQLLRFNTPERISERRLLYELLKSGIKFD